MEQDEPRAGINAAFALPGRAREAGHHGPPGQSCSQHPAALSQLLRSFPPPAFVKAPDIHLLLNISRPDRLLINLELSLQDSTARAAAVGYRRSSSRASSR